MIRLQFLVIFLSFFSTFVNAQPKLLENEFFITEIKKGLSNVYNYNFTESRKTLSLIKDIAKGHPALPFFEAFIIYWENYPLTPENPDAEQFLSLLEESNSLSTNILLKDPANIEAIFFDLFSRAFYMMFWADNGKPFKVIPYLSPAYKQLIAGFSLKEELNEFYFPTGLYNYYIIAYPEKHPAYKPLAMLFRKGNKEYGLDLLQYCAENSVFLRTEARFFLSVIFLNYENNYKEASGQASFLYKEFPKNSFYTAHYARILLLNEKFTMADILITHLENEENDYSIMSGNILRAIYLEKYKKDYEAAYSKFQKGFEMSQHYEGPPKEYHAMALMGMGRYHQRQANFSTANRYFKTAKSFCSYDYIINDKL